MSESNIQQNTGKPNDEIDIFEFSLRIWKAFVNFLIGIRDFFVSILIFFIRKSLWIVSFGIAGMLLGFMLYEISRPFYTSVLEGNTGGFYDIDERKFTGGVDNSVVIDHINRLNRVTGKPSLLANYLGISIEQAKEIRSIKAYYGIDVNKDMKPDYVDEKETYNPKDSSQIRVPSFVHIKVAVFDENIFPELRRGLLRYINNNTYIQELFRIDRQQKEKMILEIDKEIKNIDNLQEARIRKESSIEQGTTFVVVNEPEPKLFYRDVLSLQRRKQLLEKNLELSDEVIVIVHDFTPLQQEERTVSKYVGILGASMAVLGFFCALLWHYRKRIWELIREDSSK